MIGVDPGPLTLRELCWMLDGRQKQLWSHTSSLMALMANGQRNIVIALGGKVKSRKPFTPEDFDPFGRKTRHRPADAIIVDKTNIHVLREAFTGQKGKEEK